eukprot:gb/GECG01001936.1/.p1 GENE.gb/GECG01001936.1/~~gb/GECG01001936.1/.p1  ORF type:complete len:138 (+),score=27.06 gb/GECG01001936.1/:1-414(+)
MNLLRIWRQHYSISAFYSTCFFVASFLLLLWISHSFTVECYVRQIVPYIGGKFFGFRSINEIETMLKAGERKKEDEDDEEEELGELTADGASVPRQGSRSDSVDESKGGAMEQRSAGMKKSFSGEAKEHSSEMKQAH